MIRMEKWGGRRQIIFPTDERIIGSIISMVNFTLIIQLTDRLSLMGIY